ncbi:MAG: hypothetical protein KAS85_04575 [Rhodobacteraceae bacterium]|nr:hypothetical protein [Paracoccaceae bacterium]MCK5642581.1 hypothetical protein [Gammaproteobacteria bacterium]
MTFSAIDTCETNTIKLGSIKTFGAAVLARINDYRAERKELKSLYSHHTATDATLAQAQRDVSRVWY